ncbi:hypothetical protein SAMN04488057_1022 [Cyclobacterium lianum]|uniref:Reverse transcriptase (RNA-dependent DNA polymerase) n=1 Tax=Cyclobacterium lianum TaxID=388280 RepID=A0A1M7JGE3_9BACT|nr:hypothetical protein SAMN04488057_1022 [Cyclobacterium lianum]
MIEKVLNRKNLYKAYRQVVRNKGSAGVDGMKVSELFSYLENNRDRIATSILNHTYVPKPIKGGTKRELRARLSGATQEQRKDQIIGGSHSSGKVAATGGKPGADDQIRTYVRGIQLWLSTAEEHPQGGFTSPEK